MVDLFGTPVPPPTPEPTGRKGNQIVLFAEISSVSFDQQQILSNILTLFVKQPTFDCDPTYGFGKFYDAGIPNPRYCFDIAPKRKHAVAADCRTLPLKDGSVRSLVFDPPFMVRRGNQAGMLHQNYGSYDKIADLRRHYQESITEFARVLKPNGILVFKCQDQCHKSGNLFLHNEVLVMAEQAGFRPKDLFILVARNRYSTPNLRQHYARKYYSYFWLFKRKSSEKAKD